MPEATGFLSDEEFTVVPLEKPVWRTAAPGIFVPHLAAPIKVILLAAKVIQKAPPV
jgi:hypothetical protein